MLANLLIEMVPRGGIDWSALGTDTGIFSQGESSFLHL
jgi:hypothetical protein